MINSVIGYTGYEALKNMCYSFYEYVTKNQGVFSAMFWYNKFESSEKNNAITKSYDRMFKILKPLTNLLNSIIIQWLYCLKKSIRVQRLHINRRRKKEGLALLRMIKGFYLFHSFLFSYIF